MPKITIQRKDIHFSEIFDIARNPTSQTFQQELNRNAIFSNERQLSAQDDISMIPDDLRYCFRQAIYTDIAFTIIPQDPLMDLAARYGYFCKPANDESSGHETGDQLTKIYQHTHTDIFTTREDAIYIKTTYSPFAIKAIKLPDGRKTLDNKAHCFVLLNGISWIYELTGQGERAKLQLKSITIEYNASQQKIANEFERVLRSKRTISLPERQSAAGTHPQPLIDITEKDFHFLFGQAEIFFTLLNISKVNPPVRDFLDYIYQIQKQIALLQKKSWLTDTLEGELAIYNAALRLSMHVMQRYYENSERAPNPYLYPIEQINQLMENFLAYLNNQDSNKESLPVLTAFTNARDVLQQHRNRRLYAKIWHLITNIDTESVQYLNQFEQLFRENYAPNSLEPFQEIFC